MRSLVLFAAAVILSACATDSNQTQFEKVKPKQRVYVGNVKVKLNGEPAEKCELFMNTNLTPDFKLSDDGYVVYKTSTRKPAIGKIRCLHSVTNRKAAWHTQDIELNPLKRPKKRKSINYFGHIVLDWKINPKLTTAAPVQNPGAFKQVGMVSDSGEIKFKIDDQTKTTTEYIQNNWLALNDFRVETHLVTEQVAGEDEELEEYED